MKFKALLISCLVALTAGVTGYAYEFPNTFWTPNENYATALEQKDYSGVVKYGKEIIDIIKKEQDFKETRNALINRYQQVGLAYESLEQYEEAAKIFNEFYEYILTLNLNPGEEFYDYNVSAKARRNQYTPELKMYTDNGAFTYYGAKNEKQNGVLFGICADSKTRAQLGNESMILLYQELGQSIPPYSDIKMKEAEAEGLAVEFALNCLREGNDIRNIKAFTSSLEEVSKLLKRYPSVPVYLRFGAEFDIWTDLAQPEEFKEAFRYVSQFFRTRNSNVAMVWSPNQVSNWDIEVEDYYPGDEYVDWVGMSSYAQKYFRGDKNQPEEYEIVFKSGINSEPVIAVKDLVEKFGDRKPIMLSESGCGHTLPKLHEDSTDFALHRLREYYLYLPMVYPQIKLIAYFDKYDTSFNENNDFSLVDNDSVLNEYLKLVKSERFIQDSYNNDTNLCYREVKDGLNVGNVFRLSSYSHMYNTDTESVAYYIDEKFVGSSKEIPYNVYVNAKDFSGTHTLKAVATYTNGKKQTTESSININNPGNKISVEVSGRPVEFDQEPIIYNDRTMVPMRKIFEALGAEVTWDNDTKTATGIKGNRVVKLSLGQKKMYINNNAVELDTVPILLSDRTLVPARAVAEGLGCDVGWDGGRFLVTITPKE